MSDGLFGDDQLGNWIELPGPAEWWPDTSDGIASKHYFRVAGFAPRGDCSVEYRQALDALEQPLPPPGWEAMIEHGHVHDLIWKRNFLG